MTGQEINDVRDRVEQEGFHYAFVHYSDFEQVRDEEFHRLRKAFTDASRELADYLGIEE